MQADWDDGVTVDLLPEFQSHWFCHSCKVHFGVPVHDHEDATKTFLCPACGSSEIEDEED